MQTLSWNLLMVSSWETNTKPQRPFDSKPVFTPFSHMDKQLKKKKSMIEMSCIWKFKKLVRPPVWPVESSSLPVYDVPGNTSSESRRSFKSGAWHRQSPGTQVWFTDDGFTTQQSVSLCRHGCRYKSTVHVHSHRHYNAPGVCTTPYPMEEPDMEHHVPFYERNLSHLSLPFLTTVATAPNWNNMAVSEISLL